MIVTTGDLITFTLRASGINGVGQTPIAEDSNTGLDMLRMVIAQWQQQRWLVWSETTISLLATGADFYTIGPGADFDVPSRPTKLHAAWCRMLPGAVGAPNPVDIPLAIIEAKENWSTIGIKDLKSLPSSVFLDTSWPIGRVYFWPVPPVANHYEMFLVLSAALPTYTTLVDPLNLPPEYLEAVMWSLCVRLQMAYGLPARQDHSAAMRQAMNVVMLANTQMATLALPSFGRYSGDVSSWAGRGLNRAWVVGSEAVL
jgi:hypothetical protein